MIATWVNGVLDGSVSATDRGLQYGDGLFETMAVLHGHIRLRDAHLARLAAGCGRLGIQGLDADLIIRDLGVAAASMSAGVVKLIVTRGHSERGYRATVGATPTRIVSTYPAPAYPGSWAESGVAIRVCATRLSEQPALAGMKHLNRLEQVLARSEWEAPEPQEGLMLDGSGRVIGGTMSNVFAVIHGQLLTPRIDRCGVSGVMRGAVLAAASRAGMPVVECDLSLEVLCSGEEILLTNALIGVWSVRQFEHHIRPPGPMYRIVRGWIAAM